MGMVWNDKLGIPRSSIEGVDKVMNKINKELSAMINATQGGLIKAAGLIRWETEKGSVITPVDYGNLRASWFVVTSAGKIAVGGGKKHTTEGAAASFKGPQAANLAKGHSNMLAEMSAKAKAIAKFNDGPVVIMGYSANYAMWVHERVDPSIKWKRARSGPKWFEIALKKHARNIPKMVAGNARIKGFNAK